MAHRQILAHPHLDQERHFHDVLRQRWAGVGLSLEPGLPPSAQEVARARQASGFTRAQAAELVRISDRHWANAETSGPQLNLNTWELFLAKATPIPERVAALPPAPVGIAPTASTQPYR